MGKLLSRINYSEHPGRAPLLSLVLSQPQLPCRAQTTGSAHSKGKGNPNSPLAAQNRGKIWASKGNCGMAAAKPQGLQKDRSSIPTEQHENGALGVSNSSLFHSDAVIEFLHKPFLLGVRGMRHRPEQISETLNFGHP